MDSVDGEIAGISAAAVAELQARIAALSNERDDYKRLAELLQRELDRLRDQQKTPREHVDAAQVQLAFAAIAAQRRARRARVGRARAPSSSALSRNDPLVLCRTGPHEDQQLRL